MALAKRSSPTPPQKSATRDLKQRVISSLNKLSDRDTYTIACTELETIAQSLTPDSFSSFLSCIYATDSSHKSPVRRQCVRILSVLAAAHRDDLAPFISRMIANVVIRRLRDSDSSIRSACVDALAAMASEITSPPFGAFLKPLTEALLLEQDCSSQAGAAQCLAAAIEATPHPDLAQLQRLLPRLLKLLRSPGFKAKPALLSLIGSIVGVHAASDTHLVGLIIPCLVEFLSSEDWAARKAASDAFARLAIAERDLLPEFKDSCIVLFEARKFDKVKAVRDTMTWMLDAWKDVPDISTDVPTPPQLKSSSVDGMSDGHFPAGSRSTNTLKSNSPSTWRKRSPSKSTPLGGDKRSSPTSLLKLDRKNPLDWKVEITVPNVENSKGMVGRSREQVENENSRHSKNDVKRVLFDDKHDDKTRKFGGLRSGSRVVPFHEKESSESTVEPSNATEEHSGSYKDNDLSSIRKQLIQIEKQQSSLLDLLQRFIGNSQSGMCSLETRVQGLEMALDEISHDLAVTTGRMGNAGTAANACFKLPGAEFLSSKLWRKQEGRYSSSRFSTLSATASVAMHNMTDKEASDPFQLESRRFGLKGGFVVNPLAEIHPHSKGSSELLSNKLSKNGIVHEKDGGQVDHNQRLN